MTLPKVLFVCIGNSCRSQMAEGLARATGSDVLSAYSVGLAPATLVSRLTREVMAGRGIDISEQFPKGLTEIDVSQYDLVVNMSGYSFPVRVAAPVLDWDVPDPMGGEREDYERVAAQIEGLMEELVAELRERPGGQLQRMDESVT